MSNLDELFDEASDKLGEVPRPPDLSEIDLEDLAEHGGQGGVFVMEIHSLFVQWAEWLSGAGAVLQHTAALIDHIDELKGASTDFKRTWEGRLDAGHGSKEA